MTEWEYGNAEWGDLLTNWNGQPLEYDSIGNLTAFGTEGAARRELFWNGRQLKSIRLGQGAAATSILYEYNSDGLRISRTTTDADGQAAVTKYIYNGDILAGEIRDDGKSLLFYYDNNGQPFGLRYNGTDYYYLRNLQNDVAAIADGTGAIAARYYYDAWGNLLSVTDGAGHAVTDAEHIGLVNPIRYRGYYYDSDTGYYWLNSRYYDPVVGRWISPEPNVYDGEFDENAGLIGYNVYAYCANNPIMYKDETGESITLCILIGAGIGLVAGGVFGAYRANKNGYSPSDGWKYWKYVVGYGVAGGAIGALVGWGAGALIAKYGVATAATSITKGGGARFPSFSALKRSLGSAGRGKQWHHIVEQCQIGKSGFSKYWIQNSNNVINISNSVHNKISAYYSSIQNFTNGMTFRNWLAGQSFKTQYEWGIKVLRMFGVKI